MKRLSRKESMAIATIHDALRELRIKGRHAHITMFCDEINISEFADTEEEAKELKKLFCFFKDEDDTIEVRRSKLPGEESEYFTVKLRKLFV